MLLEYRMSALPQLHLHCRLNTWLQWIGHRQLQDETGIIQVLVFGATYIRDLTVITIGSDNGLSPGRRQAII